MKKRYIGQLHRPEKVTAEVTLNTLTPILPITAMHLGKTARFVTFEATVEEAESVRHLFRVLEEVQAYTIPPEPPETLLPFGIATPDLPALMEYLQITEIWKDPEFKAGANLRYAHIDTGLINDDKRFGDRIKGTFLAPGIAPSKIKHNHGTIGCSIVAREITYDGETPYQGALPKLTIFDIQVLDNQGYGETDGVAWSIDKAVELDVHWMNLSLGGKHSDILDDCIKRAREAGVIVVCACGNMGHYPGACCGTINCPADAPDALAVGATDGAFYEVPDEPKPERPDRPEREQRKWLPETVQQWTDRNPIPWSRKTQENYDVAPGVKIKVGIINAPATGTSFAAPTKGTQIGVCLDAAYRKWPSLSKTEIAEKVIALCYSVGVDLGYYPDEAKCLQGYGRINPLTAYRKIVDSEEPKLNQIYGAVRDKPTGEIIAGALVSLGAKSQVADGHGTYRFTEVDDGEYLLSAQGLKHQKSSRTIYVSGGKEFREDFELLPITEEKPLLVEIAVDGTRLEDHEAKQSIQIRVSKQ